MDQLSQLVVCLHPGGAWDSSDRTTAPINASRRNYFRSRSGRALYVAICNMHQHISLHHQDAPPAATASCSSPPIACSTSGAGPQGESSLVLREVLVKTPDGRRDLLQRNTLLLADGSKPCSLAGVVPSLRYTRTTEGATTVDYCITVETLFSRARSFPQVYQYYSRAERLFSELFPSFRYSSTTVGQRGSFSGGLSSSLS